MALTMEKLNCEMFDLTIQFDEKDFKKKEFKKEVGCKKKDHNIFSASFRNKKGTEHAHAEIRFNKDKSRFQLVAHQGEVEGEIEPDDVLLEDAIKIYNEFFTNKTAQATLTALFQYDEQFEPLLKLRYPLLLESELLGNAVVTGHIIEFPDNSKVDRIVITKTEGHLIVFITVSFSIDMSKYKLYSGITEAKKYILELVRQKEVKNEKTNGS